jgi:16S rRNA C967 or C1407 C5-methylase (RsmB/RsmF family)
MNRIRKPYRSLAGTNSTTSNSNTLRSHASHSTMGSSSYNRSTKRGLKQSSENYSSDAYSDSNTRSFDSQRSFTHKPFFRTPSQKPKQTTSPDFWLNRYAQWGFAQKLPVDLPQTIRVNTLKCPTVPSIAGATLTKIPFLENGYKISSSFNIVSSASYLGGLIHIQESASQLAVDLLKPKPGMTVLDVCCAPSSKTAQLCAYMENTGTIIGVDSDYDRLQKSCYMLERLGVKNTTLIHMDAKKIANLPYTFDMILVDAPCSGNFAIDRNWFFKRTMADVELLAQKQKQLLAESLKLLKVGGQLLYCTCSLELEENELVIESVLSDSIQLCRIEETFTTPGLTSRTTLAKRVWPTQHGCSGFFYALLQKTK